MSAELTNPSAGVDDRIVAATLAVLRDRGYAALSMEGVAADAGVAKTTVYRRYRNRADLATAAIAVNAPDPPDRRAEPRRALEQFLAGFARGIQEVGLDVLGAMMADGEDPEAMELHRERVIHPRVKEGVALLRAAQERGEVRPDADPRLALEMMVGSYFALSIGGREVQPEEWAREVVDAAWRGLEPRDAG